MEARRDIARHAVEHALVLGRVRSGRGLEECLRRINGRLVKSTIVMVRKVQGVGWPGIHVELFYQPICEAKQAIRKIDTWIGEPSSSRDEGNGDLKVIMTSINGKE